MAGRGTDILLGGNAEFMARQQALAEEIAERLPKSEARFVDDDEFVYFYHLDNFYRVPRAQFDPIFDELRQQCDGGARRRSSAVGGLHIIGTERHEARRIDNQLRGRAGRQGDPGSSRFYLSLEDDLMRIFGSDRISGLMERLGMEEGVPIEHRMVTKAIERAQRQVEAQNFSVRKHLLEYDDVMNKQRENVYALRRQLLEGRIKLEDEDEPLAINVPDDRRRGRARRHRRRYCDPGRRPQRVGHRRLKEEVEPDLRRRPASLTAVDEPGLSNEDIQAELWDVVSAAYTEKEAAVGTRVLPPARRPSAAARRAGELADVVIASPEEQPTVAGRAVLEPISRSIMLQVVDAQWKDHLYSLDHLKEGIGLRGYGQRDPLVEYKKESFALFQGMKARIDEEIVRYLWRLRPVISAEPGYDVGPRGGEAPASVRQPAGARRSAPRPSSLTFSDGKQQAALPRLRRRRREQPRRAEAGPHRRRRRAQ